MSEWAPFAIRRDGPPWKAGYTFGVSGPKRGEVKHSAVGSWAGMQSVLDGPVQSSWHFSVLQDGRVFQHYALSTHCWHGNDTDSDQGVRANLDLIGIEHEGGAPGNLSEPLTEAQLAATVAVSRWAAEQYGFARFGRFPEQWDCWTLAEHNQVGNTPTACPSGRIPWDEVIRRLEEVPVPEPTQPSEAEALRALVRAGTIIAAGDLNLAGLSEVDKNALRWIAAPAQIG